MKLRTILARGAAAVALMGASAAHAGTYVSLFGGLSFPDDQSFSAGPFSDSTVTSKAGYDGTLYFKHGTGQFTVNNPYQFRFTYATRRLRFTNGTYYSTYIPAFRTGTTDDGFVVGGAFGFDLANGFRAELEAAYRKYDLSGSQHFIGTFSSRNFVTARQTVTGTVYEFTTGVKAPYSVYAIQGGAYTSGDPFIFTAKHVDTTGNTTTASGTATTTGEIKAFSLMANVWYDFDLDGSPITPFIGGGIGMAQLDVSYRVNAHLNSTFYTTHYESISSIFGVTFGPYTASASGSGKDWVFAWQLGAGLGYELGGGMMLSAQYRYFATGDADIGGGQSVDVKANEVLIGLNIPLGN